MRIYSENENGYHLFYVEITECDGYGNFIESSFPETVFNLPDVRSIARKIFTSEFNSQIMLKQVDLLVNLFKTKRELNNFYFQPVELKFNGKYNIEQSNVLNELLINQKPPTLEFITINTNPFLFRLICKQLFINDRSQLATISKQFYERPFIEKSNFNKINSDTYLLNVEYKLKVLKNYDEVVMLFAKYYGEHPYEFYFKYV